jgi:hypothetical protein
VAKLSPKKGTAEKSLGTAGIGYSDKLVFGEKPK